jgi:hypothetical protein
LQRLPPHRIQRADELSEIALQEDPATTSLGSGNEAALRARANFLRVHAEKAGGLVEIKGSHGRTVTAVAASSSAGCAGRSIQSPESSPHSPGEIIGQGKGKVS